VGRSNWNASTYWQSDTKDFHQCRIIANNFVGADITPNGKSDVCSTIEFRIYSLIDIGEIDRKTDDRLNVIQPSVVGKTESECHDSVYHCKVFCDTYRLRIFGQAAERTSQFHNSHHQRLRSAGGQRIPTQTLTHSTLTLPWRAAPPLKSQTTANCAGQPASISSSNNELILLTAAEGWTNQCECDNDGLQSVKIPEATRPPTG